MIEQPLATRRGARRPDLVPQEVLAQLHRGETETVNLMEQIAMSFPALCRSVFPDAPDLHDLSDPRLVHRMRAGGRLVLDIFGWDRLHMIQAHASDTVRAWGAMAVGAKEGIPLGTRFEGIRPFANDSHFAVREWAWIAARPWITSDLSQALNLLSRWVDQESPFLRRFAIESTRPRSVWATHIPALKRNPGLALHLLEPLADDPHRYVQDSVANWLNDAARSQPGWVENLCETWASRFDSPAARRLQRRALRTITRTANAHR